MTQTDFLEFLKKFNEENLTEDDLFEIGVTHKELPLGVKNWSALNEMLGMPFTTGENYRCWVKQKLARSGELPRNSKLLSNKTVEDLSTQEMEDEIQGQIQDLYKQQVKTRDSLNAYRRMMREEARLDDFKALMKELVVDITKLPKVVYHPVGNTYTEAVLMLSDLHIGVEIDNYYNKYNITIARKRVNKLIQDVIRYCVNNNVQRLNILGLGDYCQGHIHTSARLEQQIDVVEQIMVASEIIADTLNQLQAAAPDVRYYSVTDNHSRMTPSLKESIEAENYGKLITFYLKERLRDTNITFEENVLDQEIGMINFQNGKTGVFVHGHHDNITTLFQNMTAYTGIVVDYAFVGHYHCEKLKTFNNFKVYVNGSIVGVDQYAFSKRLFGKPSQTLLIFDGDNVLHHSINLDIQE
jgi:hypothetical protein